MADLTPLADIQSFAGTTIGSSQHVTSKGYPNFQPNDLEALVSTLGSLYPVDLYNGTAPPLKEVLTCQLLIRAQDSTTDPAAAWTEVVTGYRALRSLPMTGTLVWASTPGGGTVSCTAKRKQLPAVLAPKNARHMEVTLTFNLLSPWV